MINKNQASEIRTCERIKFDQALYILTMYEKKIRIPLSEDDISNKPIDAEQEYQETILRSWNKKWKMDLTKPVLNCVTSVHPRVYHDSKNIAKSNIKARQYNRIMQILTKRLRVQHEDQSNFKIVEQYIDQIGPSQSVKRKGHLLKSIIHFVDAIRSMTEQMKNSVASKQDKLDSIQDTDTYPYTTITILEGVLNVVEQFQNNLEENQQIFHFMYSVIKVLDDIKQSEYGATVIAAQPNLGNFTYLLHPLLLPLYSNLLLEKQRVKKKLQNKQQMSENNNKKLNQQSASSDKPFRQFFTSNTSSLSKTVFINLDGYQSQYNLQFIRCFRKNIMYVSFPKQDVHSKNDDNAIYQKRFFKKLMYNYEKNIQKGYESTLNQQSSMQDQIDHELNEKYILLNNTEDYFNNVQKQLYEFQKGYEDLNKNMYIFPLRLHALEQNFHNLREETQDILQLYQSTVILQIFRYFLINQIREFNPTHIIVSYSGRLRIQDKHFVQIIQQLTKLSHYKVILFPNMTAAFGNGDTINHNINTTNITYLKKPLNSHNKQANQNQMKTEKQNEREQTDIHQIGLEQLSIAKNQQIQSPGQINYSFFNKLIRFLKVSSGTHNLMKQYQEEGSLTKFKNLYVLKKINRLLETLGLEYQNIERIRFKNKEIDLIPKLYQDDYNRLVKMFEKLIPRYYCDLYDVIEAMVTIFLAPQNHENYELASKLLKDFGINQQAVINNIQVHELIQCIKDKIVIRSVISQQIRNTMQYQNIIRNLKIEREKHFMEIAQQKYQQSTLLYFRVIKSAQLFEQTIQNKLNLRGLLQVSFSNPNKQSKQPIQIYQATQIHYRIDQCSYNTNSIPVLIMNNLPLDKKCSPKFDNYCAMLDRNTVNKMLNVNNNMTNNTAIDKIPEIRKQKKVYPIKFYDQENNLIIEHRFQFRVEWNYIETENYMILYWPKLFNMVDAISWRIQGKVQQSPILSQVFISNRKVQNQCINFYQASTPEDIVPRSGCTGYAFNNQIYIFGGFYERQKNYLNLNRDITRWNLQYYDHQTHKKLQMVNQKTNLYPHQQIKQSESMQQCQSQNNKKNSYVRARQQYQFYDLPELKLNQPVNNQQNMKYVVMIGGYGQNYLHPYSMLTYYYYLLKFRVDNGILVSVQKKLIYNKSVPINIRNCSKNLGIIKTNTRTRNQNSHEKKISPQPELTDPDSYARSRVVYKIDEKNGEFLYKFQFIFSEKDLKMYKEQLRKINDVTEMNGLRMQKIEGINDKFLVQRYGLKQIVHLRLQLSQKIDVQDQYINLTNQSVTYLNIVNGNYICAIIKHPLYTNGESMIVQCRQKTIDTINQEQTSFLNLKPISNQPIKGDLSLHILQASNINLVYALHGHRIFQSEEIHQYHITNNRRDGSKIISQIKPKKPLFSPQMQSKIRCCYSSFFYEKANRRNQIICQSYVSMEDSNEIYQISQKFEPMDNSNLHWQEIGKPIIFYFCLKSWNNPVRLDRMTFLEFYKNKGNGIIVVQYNKRKYRIDINQNKVGKLFENGQIGVMLEDATQEQIRRLEEDEGDKGTILHKKPDHYFDRGYVKI